MKKKIGKILVLGIILIFLGVAFAPSLNAISISKNKPVIKEKSNLNNDQVDLYYFCTVKITTVGSGGSLYWDKQWSFYFFDTFDAIVTIKAPIANVGYIWRTNYELTLGEGVTSGIIFGFIGKASSYHIQGFAFCVAVAVV